MAKQKSGLGRGLDALFGESPLAPTAPVSKEEPKQDASPASKEGAPEPAPIEAASAEAVPAAPAKSSSGVYFSEDDLENAKVVTREARKPTMRNARTSHPTSHLFHKDRDVRAASDAQQGAAQALAAEEARVSTRPAAPVPQTPAPAVAPVPKKEDKGDTGIVALDLIQPNPDQPRTQFKREEIEELAGSIKKEGLLQPILVRKMGDHYQIIAGERRYQACRSLGLEEVSVRFWTADADKALELALIENIQRSDLNPIEEAYGYKRLMERKGMTQSEVAQTVSKGRSTIANALRLLDLPEDAQQLLFEDKITAGHARAILSIPDAEGRKTLTKKLMEEKLSVRETENIARLLSGKAKASASGVKRVPAPASFKKAAKGLTQYFSAPVRVKTAQGKNKIEIQFKDEADLERIMKMIAEGHADVEGSES